MSSDKYKEAITEYYDFLRARTILLRLNEKCGTNFALDDIFKEFKSVLGDRLLSCVLEKEAMQKD